MSYTYIHKTNKALSTEDRAIYRRRLWADLFKMIAGMVLVVAGVQLVIVPKIGFIFAGVVAGAGAYLFISAFSRRAEDYFVKKDLLAD